MKQCRHSMLRTETHFINSFRTLMKGCIIIPLLNYIDKSMFPMFTFTVNEECWQSFHYSNNRYVTFSETPVALFISLYWFIADLSTLALVHKPVGAALDSTHIVYRTDLWLLQLDLASLLQWQFLLCLLLYGQGLLWR